MTLLRQLGVVFDRQHRLDPYLALALSIVAAVLETVGVIVIPGLVVVLSQPERALRVVGEGRFESPAELLLAATAAVAAFVVVKGVVQVGIVYWQADFVARNHARLAQRLLRAYLAAPYAAHLQRNSAALLRTATHETTMVFNGVVTPAITLVTEAIVLVALSAILLRVQPIPALAALGIMAATALAYYRVIRRRLGERGREQKRFAEEMFRWLNQSVGSFKETRILGKERFFLDRYREAITGYTRAARANQVAGQLPRYLIESAAMLALTVVLLVLLLRGGDVASILPGLTLFAVAAVRLLPSLNRIAMSVAAIRSHVSCLEDVSAELLRQPRDDAGALPGDTEGAAPARPFERAIELRGVTFRYQGAAAPALSDVSLTIPKGAVVGLIGASGAGKTTLVDIVLGLLTPGEGSVLVDGADIADDLRGWRRQVGYVPQNIYLYDDTVRRNVAFGVGDEAIDDAQLWRALERAQLAEMVRRLPAGLDTVIGEHGARVSGGQRQRIGIARALYHEPAVLVLDEATSALDSRTESGIVRVLEGLRGEKTLIVIAHRLTTIRQSDVLFLLHEGRVAASGTFEALSAESAEFRQLAGVA